jgi:serine/threonine-protein kinase
MELLEGRTLRALLDERTRLPAAEAVEILLSAMQGVEAAHQAGVVHRDLKPDNLFVCTTRGRRGMTKVLDFGVSKIVDASDSEKLTKTGTAVGTPHYMSPEQIVASPGIDARSDVYALGAILYQSLTGRLPFEAHNFSALVVQIAMASPEPFGTHAPPEAAPIEPIVMRAIAKKPDDRFPDVASFARALEPFANGLRFEPPAQRARSVPPPSEVSARRPEASSPDASTRVAVPVEVTPALVEAPTMLASEASGTTPTPSAARRAWPPGAVALLVGVLALILVVVGLATRPGGAADDTPGSDRRVAPAAPAAASPRDEPSRSEVPAELGPARPEALPPEPEVERETTTEPRFEAAPNHAPSAAPRRRVVTAEPPGPRPTEPAVRTGQGRSGTISTDDF